MYEGKKIVPNKKGKWEYCCHGITVPKQHPTHILTIICNLTVKFLSRVLHSWDL